MLKNTKKLITSYFSEEIKKALEGIDDLTFEEIEEIRIRVKKPIIIKMGRKELFLTRHGTLLEHEPTTGLDMYKPEMSEISKILELISSYSLYAFEEEIKNGYITLAGGHRVGLTGRAVLEKGEVKTIRNVNGFNFRISHEIIGCASNVLEYIAKGDVKNTLIISPPACGKTTLLRDLARQISDGVESIIKGQAVAIVDERSEIAGSYMGIPQNDVGLRTDVLDGCPKDYGMLVLLRAMAPRVIVVDEIGRQSDIFAIESIINAGVKLICSVHGNGIEDILQKPILSDLIHKKVFDRFVVLQEGYHQDIYNENFKLLNFKP